MCGIQDITRKHGTYYYRKLKGLGADKPFRLRLSCETTDSLTPRISGARSSACRRGLARELDLGECEYSSINKTNHRQVSQTDHPCPSAAVSIL
tara:strand:+ start:53 stop:334 length:282 start_codon:yes stop_codon:yes gene_type:complete